MSAPTEMQFTRTICPGCGAAVDGLNERYACTLCGWVNRWDQSRSPLPSAADDPDCPPPEPA